MTVFVEIPGSDSRMHKVPAQYADLFRDGKTGELISDEQWDEQIRRIREFEPDFKVV